MSTSNTSVRVLIVDDNVDLADSLAELLSLEDFAARAVYSGQEALDVSPAFQPHCILLDIQMPGLDGLELARRLRAAHGDDVILLAMTGRDVNDARVADAFAIVDHYFAKPLELATLLKVLRPG